MKRAAWSVPLVVVASAAAGQTTGSRLPGANSAMMYSAGYYSDTAESARLSGEAIEAANAMARCLVKQQRRTAVRYLDADVTGRKAALDAFGPLLSGCLSQVSRGVTKLEMSYSARQGALARQMLDRDAADRLPAIEPSKTERPAWLSDDANQRVVQEMAICLADRYPGQSNNFVSSSGGSSEETTAFAALSPNLGSCLIQGTTLRANKEGIRLALATALYHRVNNVAVAIAPVRTK